MEKDIAFQRYSSIRIGPICRVLLIEEKDSYDSFYILGKANNVLISDTPPPLAILSKKFNYITLNHNTLTIGAATPSGKILSFCKQHNIGGFEILEKLPGSLGGLVKMNAGLKGDEIGKNLLHLQTHREIIAHKDMGLGYRTSTISDIIYEATFHCEKGFDTQKLAYYQQLRKNQPKEPSAGSCFKNPEGDYAGRLMETVGLKGHKIGDAAFSKEHANFLVNLGCATYDDAKKLIKTAQNRVFETYGIKLQLEIILLDQTHQKTKLPYCHSLI
jgi:UDP-N-acetylmuramate dehydrogenase